MTDSLFSKEEALQICEIIKKNWNNEGSYSDLLIMEFLFDLEDYIDAKKLCVGGRTSEKRVENKIKEFFVSSEVERVNGMSSEASSFLKLMTEEIKNKIILIML